MAKEHVVQARALIEAGWTKHRLVGRTGVGECYCLDGAVLKAHKPDGIMSYATLRFDAPDAVRDLEYLIKFIPESERYNSNDAITAAYSFNDAHYRTKDEVLAVFDRAIMSYPKE